jgi:hypothetical protein
MVRAPGETARRLPREEGLFAGISSAGEDLTSLARMIMHRLLIRLSAGRTKDRPSIKPASLK